MKRVEIVTGFLLVARLKFLLSRSGTRTDSIIDKTTFNLSMEADATTAGELLGGVLGHGMTPGFTSTPMPMPAPEGAPEETPRAESASGPQPKPKPKPKVRSAPAVPSLARATEGCVAERPA